jgi:periplasmic copper chaperone A
MMTKFSLFMAAMSAFFALSTGQMASAADIVEIEEPYVRVSGVSAKSGAVFMTILNPSTQDDRLVSVTTDIAERAELHTHTEDANGVMRMGEVTEGFPIPATEAHALDRGGDHIMLLGLTRALKQGDMVTLTLTFEKSGDITVEVPVDNERAPGAHGKMDHGKMNHGGHTAPATN